MGQCVVWVFVAVVVVVVAVFDWRGGRCGPGVRPCAGNATALELRVNGVNFGAACVGCVSTWPSTCATAPCDAPSSLCANATTVVRLASPSVSTATWPCDVLCVSASTTVSSIRCLTAFPFVAGSVTVSVSGQSSPPFGFDVSSAFNPPALEEGSVSPSSCSTSGCTAVLRGQYLSGCEVLVRNALGTVVVPGVSTGGSELSVGVVGGMMMIGSVRGWCEYCWRACRGVGR
jgi:hypothetical protein